jgi:hypothetical protein
MASTIAQTSLSNATTGTGTTVDFLVAKKTVTAVLVAGGTIAKGVVTIEASQDNVNWVALSHLALDQGVNVAASFAGQAYRYWRASVAVDLAGGGKVAVTFMEAD